MNERRKHFTPVQPVPFVPVTNNCKWVMPGSFTEEYCLAMGWEPLIVEPDGILFRAPADFNETGTRAQA